MDPLTLDPPPLFDRLRAALLEDLTAVGDLTSQALVNENKTARAEVLFKADGVLCGIKLLPLIFQMAEQLVSAQAAGRAWDLDDTQAAASAGKISWDEALAQREKTEAASISVQLLKKDGEHLQSGTVVATISGNARAVLAGERLALNLLSHLSGIATKTARWTALIAHTKAKLLDTRKTIPLWRDLQRMAVKCGGGENHRKGLYHEILIKDNHLALWGLNDPAGAVRAARARFPSVRIEVEVTTLEQLQNVIDSSMPDMVLLDNMKSHVLSQCVAFCDHFFKTAPKTHLRPLLEASGGITETNLIEIAQTGVDRISSGSLTSSVLPIDCSLKLCREK